MGYFWTLRSSLLISHRPSFSQALCSLQFSSGLKEQKYNTRMPNCPSSHKGNEGGKHPQHSAGYRACELHPEWRGNSLWHYGAKLGDVAAGLLASKLPSVLATARPATTRSDGPSHQPWLHLFEPEVPGRQLRQGAREVCA